MLEADAHMCQNNTHKYLSDCVWTSTKHDGHFYYFIFLLVGLHMNEKSIYVLIGCLVIFDVVRNHKIYICLTIFKS